MNSLGYLCNNGLFYYFYYTYPWSNPITEILISNSSSLSRRGLLTVRFMIGFLGLGLDLFNLRKLIKVGYFFNLNRILFIISSLEMCLWNFKNMSSHKMISIKYMMCSERLSIILGSIKKAMKKPTKKVNNC